MTEMVSAETFKPHLNETFQIVAGEGDVVETRLTMVTALPRRLASGEIETGEGIRQPFNLIFVGPLDRVLPQATYQFVHPQLGDLDIFIVPIGPGAEGMRYEA